jgi:hypothetical protein
MPGSTALTSTVRRRTHRRGDKHLVWMLVWASLAQGACDALDSDRRPYTPFPVASGEPEKLSPAPPPPASLLPATPAPSLEVLTAPARASEWRIDERLLTAPEGLNFRLALVGGVRGGKDHDVLAWAVGTPDRPVVGELWLYPEQGEPRLVLAAPGFLPTGPGCSHGARLTHAGPSTVMLDIKATCSGPLLQRAPERSVSVLAPFRAAPLVLGFRLAAPARDERLDVDVNATDRDGDGRDDVDMALRFATGEAPEVGAHFIWLARAAGLSRDMSEPRASFASIAQPDSSAAGQRDARLSIAERASSARRLYASLCAESATPRIFLEDGAALDCGDLSGAFETLTSAEIDAAVARGQLGEAFAALERYTWFPTGTAKALEQFTKKQLAKLNARVTHRKVIKIVPLEARPRSVEPTPHFSPLSFHADGSLLVQTAEGVVRAAPDGRFEYDASDEIDRWPTTVASPSGEQLVGAAFPCERSDVVWLRVAADGSPLEPISTALVAPRPGSCGVGVPFAAPGVSPVAWIDAEPSAFIGASRLGPPSPHPPSGSATSPNGRFSIVVTRWGLLVASEAKTTLWALDYPSLATQLSDCVVSNNAESAACLLQGRATVILPDPKSG